MREAKKAARDPNIVEATGGVSLFGFTLFDIRQLTYHWQDGASVARPIRSRPWYDALPGPTPLFGFAAEHKSGGRRGRRTGQAWGGRGGCDAEAGGV